MNPLIEKAAIWGVEFIDGLKIDTQQELINSLADKVGGFINSTETEIDNEVALVAIGKLQAILVQIEQVIVPAGAEIPVAQPVE